MSEREPILYRWWRNDGTLLYVGKSVSLFARISSHRKSSKFFSSAATMTIERFPDESSLATAEVRAIREEHPLYNVVHNRESGSPRMLLPTPSVEQTVASHWMSIDTGSVQVGDLIRYTFDDEVVLQGIVDEELYDCEDHDECEGWIVWVDDGSVQICHEAEFALGELQKWLSIDAEDETKSHAFGAWIHGRARLLHLDRTS